VLTNERHPGSVNPRFDNEAALKEADAKLGLQRVIEQYGHSPQDGNWKAYTCPFCDKADKCGVFEFAGTKFFKCQSTSCKTGAKAMTAVGYIAQVSGMSNRDAFIEYLKQAGVWRERTTLKNPRDEIGAPGAAQKEGAGADELSTPIPAPVATGNQNEEEAELATAGTSPEVTPFKLDKDGLDEDETLIQQCIEIIREENSAAVSLLKERLKLGYARAARIMEELERRGIVGPNKDRISREVLKLPGGALAAANIIPLHVMAKSATVAPDNRAEPDGGRSLREFFSLLILSAADEELLFKKRGLKTKTSRALQFKSSPAGNRQLLVDLEKKYGLVELLAAGLWVPAERMRKKPARPNSQFCGAGRIRKLKEGERPGRNQWQDDEGNLWGWCEPILIPYFDENLQLIGLRPHKGMGRSGTLTGTPQVYIPRGLRPTGGEVLPERFSRVFGTEGEFKAAAIWQGAGGGMTRESLSPAMVASGIEVLGVVALPGIWFGRNYECREVLDDWLARVKCRQFMVVYDNEEKGDPKYKETFQADRRKRFDAIKCARCLATDVAIKLKIRGTVGILPNDWRGEKGKADWDDGLLKIYLAK